jgi:hypothetical protein
MGFVVMDSNLFELEQGYRRALMCLSHKVRLIIEHELLLELRQRVYTAEDQFNLLGGQSRIDSVVMCLDEIDKADGTHE